MTDLWIGFFNFSLTSRVDVLAGISSFEENRQSNFCIEEGGDLLLSETPPRPPRVAVISAILL